MFEAFACCSDQKNSPLQGLRKGQASWTACDCEGSLFHQGGWAVSILCLIWRKFIRQVCELKTWSQCVRQKPRSRKLVVFAFFAHESDKWLSWPTVWCKQREKRDCRLFFWLSDMDVSENSGTPKSSISIGFSMIFTIHFGGPPLFLEPYTWRIQQMRSHEGVNPGVITTSVTTLQSKVSGSSRRVVIHWISWFAVWRCLPNWGGWIFQLLFFVNFYFFF